MCWHKDQPQGSAISEALLTIFHQCHLKGRNTFSEGKKRGNVSRFIHVILATNTRKRLKRKDVSKVLKYPIRVAIKRHINTNLSRIEDSFIYILLSRDQM